MSQMFAKTVMQQRSLHYDSIAHHASKLPKKGKRCWQGITYHIPAKDVEGLSDTDVMRLCGGRENLGAFKSITLKGDTYECFVAFRETDDWEG